MSSGEYYVDLSCEESDTEYDKESINTEPVIINYPINLNHVFRIQIAIMN